jgi:hypothetical protein
MKVKVGPIDDRISDLFYSARSIDIKPTSKTIKTPIRALTNGDLNAKAGAPLDISLESPIAGIHIPLKNQEVQAIFSKPTAISSIINRVEGFSQQMQHSSLILPLIQPYHTSLEDTLKKDERKRKFFRLVYQMQKEAGLSNFCVPWLGFSKNKTIQFYDEILKGSDDDFIFFLDARSDPNDIFSISQFLKQHVETERIKFIGVLHQPVRNAMVCYDTLWETFKESNVGIVLSDIERVDLHNPVSGAYASSSHLNEFIVGDIFMSRVSSGGGGEPSKTPVSHRLKVFNSDELSVKPIEKYSDSKWIGNITQTISDPLLENKLTNYQDANGDSEKYNILNYVTKVHEFVQSSAEFVRSQEYIKKEESSVYIHEKSALSTALSKNRNQKKLNGY